MLHVSLKSFWWIAECIPRTRNGHLSIPLGRWWRTIPEGSYIHATVPLSGQKVNYPAQYQTEPWVRFSAPIAVAAEFALSAPAVVQQMAAAAEPTKIHRLFRH
jgi:hypothetical protein